jgi:hypothetical protein
MTGTSVLAEEIGGHMLIQDHIMAAGRMTQVLDRVPV